MTTVDFETYIFYGILTICSNIMILWGTWVHLSWKLRAKNNTSVLQKHVGFEKTGKVRSLSVF